MIQILIELIKNLTFLIFKVNIQLTSKKLHKLKYIIKIFKIGIVSLPKSCKKHLESNPSSTLLGYLEKEEQGRV